MHTKTLKLGPDLVGSSPIAGLSRVCPFDDQSLDRSPRVSRQPIGAVTARPDAVELRSPATMVGIALGP